VFKIQG